MQISVVVFRDPDLELLFFLFLSFLLPSLPLLPQSLPPSLCLSLSLITLLFFSFFLAPPTEGIIPES